MQVPFFAVAPLLASALTVCHDGCVRSLNLSLCITGKGSQTDYVDGVMEDSGPEVVEYEARVGVGVQITASAVFTADNNLAIALSNMTVKFIEIPTATTASAQQQLGQDLTEVSAIDFVPPGSSHERYVVAFTCRHPQPNNVSCAPCPAQRFNSALDAGVQVSFISAMGLPLAGDSGRCCSDRLHEKSLSAFCLSPCGRVMVTSGKHRISEDSGSFIERLSFWTGGAADSQTPAKWKREHHVLSLMSAQKFTAGCEHVGLGPCAFSDINLTDLVVWFCFAACNAFCRLVTALATCPCPSSWAADLFFLASASPSDNDSEEYGKVTTNGVIKLRLMSAERPIDARASAVKCSLICDPKVSKSFEGNSGWTWLDKNIKTLSVCERSTVDGERAVFVVASVTFGFCVWVITHAHFKEMASSPLKISPFKCALFHSRAPSSRFRHPIAALSSKQLNFLVVSRYYRREGAANNLAYSSCIAHSGSSAQKSFVVCGHPKDWLVTVSDLTHPTKNVKPVVEVSLWERDEIRNRCASRRPSLATALRCDRSSDQTQSHQQHSCARRRCRSAAAVRQQNQARARARITAAHAAAAALTLVVQPRHPSHPLGCHAQRRSGCAEVCLQCQRPEVRQLRVRCADAEWRGGDW
jgi:hypothetical protein